MCENSPWLEQPVESKPAFKYQTATTTALKKKKKNPTPKLGGIANEWLSQDNCCLVCHLKAVPPACQTCVIFRGDISFRQERRTTGWWPPQLTQLGPGALNASTTAGVERSKCWVLSLMSASSILRFLPSFEAPWAMHSLYLLGQGSCTGSSRASFHSFLLCFTLRKMNQE